MKLPKLPTMRTPKKYRAGKLLGAVVSALEEKFAAAKQIEDIPARLSTLARLERKVRLQRIHASGKIDRARINQSKTAALGSITLATGIAGAGIVFTAPVLLPVAAVALLGTSLGYMTVEKRRERKNTNKPLHPLGRLKHLRELQRNIVNEFTQAALAHPLALIEERRVKDICGEDALLRDTLMKAFRRAQFDEWEQENKSVQLEKPALPLSTAPDLDRALSKLRLPVPKNP